MRSINFHCVSFYFIGVLLTMITAELAAQPDVEELQIQLQQIQNKIKGIQNSEDPFGKRVRSVGRQRAPKLEKQEDELFIRFYDLSDIFTVAPQYPAMRSPESSRQLNIFPIANSSSSQTSGGGFGGGGGGVFNLPPGQPAQQQPQPTTIQAARVSADSLTEAIQTMVEPEQWEDDATITMLGNTLLISATNTMHQQIADLLDLFREQWGKLKTVSVQAFWIEGSAGEISELLETDVKNALVGKVSSKKWNDFFAEAKQQDRIAYSASLCGQNGQTLHAVSGRQQFLTLSADPIFTFHGNREEVEQEIVDDIEQSVAGLQPVRHTFQNGAAIQASLLSTRGGKYVILDLHTRVNQMIESAEEEVPKVIVRDKQGQELSVALSNQPYVSYRLSTTLRCPDNEVVLAGGMTYDSQLAREHPNLYLFVKTNIHTIEEDVVGDR